jgi:hypothetical protein
MFYLQILHTRYGVVYEHPRIIVSIIVWERAGTSGDGITHLGDGRHLEDAPHLGMDLAISGCKYIDVDSGIIQIAKMKQNLFLRPSQSKELPFMEVSISDAIHHWYSRANMEDISPYSHVNSEISLADVNHKCFRTT